MNNKPIFYLYSTRIYLLLQLKHNNTLARLFIKYMLSIQGIFYYCKLSNKTKARENNFLCGGGYQVFLHK